MAHGQGLDEVIGQTRRLGLGCVRDDDDEAAASGHRPRARQELGHVRVRGGQRDVLLDAAHDGFGVGVAGSGGHEAHALGVTGDEADLVSARHAQPCDRLACGEGDLFLGLTRRGESAHFAARVDDEHNLQVRRGLVPLDDRRTGACRRRPVDFANVVTGLVGRQVHELPAAAPPQRRVLPLHDGQQLAQDGQLDARRQCVDLTRPHWHAGSPGDRRSTSAPVTAPEPR